MQGDVLSKNGGANSNQAHLGPPEDSSRRLLLLEEATLLAWASWARLGELGGKLLPQFSINRGRSEVKKGSKIQAEALPKRFREEFREGFDRSSTFFIRSLSFFDLQRVSTSNQAFRFILCTRGGPHCVSCIFILVSVTFYTPFWRA